MGTDTDIMEDIMEESTGVIIVDTPAATPTAPEQDTMQDLGTYIGILMYTVPRIVPQFVLLNEGYPLQEKALSGKTLKTICTPIGKVMSINVRKMVTGSNKAKELSKKQLTGQRQQPIRI